MLRVTARRAFVSRRERLLLQKDPAEPRDRQAAARRFFSTLHRALVHEVSSRIDRRPEGRGATGSWLRRLGAPALHIGDEKRRLETSEFSLETSRSRYRFQSGTDGVIRVYEEKGDEIRPREILSVQPTEEGYQPIRKALGKRAGYRFTSVNALVESYLAVHAR